MQVVVTAADASEAPAGRMDAAALDRIAIRVSPRVFGTRIRCVREDADVAKEVPSPALPVYSTSLHARETSYSLESFLQARPKSRTLSKVFKTPV